MCIGTQYKDQWGMEPAISKGLALNSRNQGSSKQERGRRGGERGCDGLACWAVFLRQVQTGVTHGSDPTKNSDIRIILSGLSRGKHREDEWVRLGF